MESQNSLIACSASYFDDLCSSAWEVASAFNSKIIERGKSAFVSASSPISMGDCVRLLGRGG
jgi:hypothetical protein